MTDGVARYLSDLGDDLLHAALRRCCGSEKWIEALVQARPYGSDGDLLNAAEQIWFSLDEIDWLEAAACHPRIGERSIGGWANAEQSGMAQASRRVSDQLLALNRDYEDKFGFVFLICATGLGAETMLTAIQERCKNDRQAEVQNMAAEQAKILKLRLGKLVAPKA